MGRCTVLTKVGLQHASEYARSGEGGSTGTSSTARSSAAKAASLLPVSYRYSARPTWRIARAVRVLRPDELDRSLRELHRARGSSRLAGQRCRPAAELGEVDLRKRGRAWYGVPECEGLFRGARAPPRDRSRLPPRVPLRPRQQGLQSCGPQPPSEARARRATRLRLSQAARRPRVQLLALAGKDRRVDRLGQKRVTEAKGSGCLIGDEHTMLD